MTDLVTIINTIIGGLVTVALAYIGYITIKTKAQQDTMQAAQKETAKVVIETRDWVDGLKADVLKRHAEMAEELDAITRSPESRRIAADARRDYDDHLRQRDIKIAKDVRVAKVEEQARVEAEGTASPVMPDNPYEPPKEA